MMAAFDFSSMDWSQGEVAVTGVQPLLGGLVLARDIAVSSKRSGSLGTGKSSEGSLGTGRSNGSLGTGRSNGSLGTGKSSEGSLGTGKS